MLTETQTATFADLLASAVGEPGRLLEAYTRVHTYSLGNQLLAWGQCSQRGLALGPMATYAGWLAAGRQVRRGEKAIALCQPVTVRRTTTDEAGEESAVAFTRFTYRAKWFVLAQTDGAAFVPPAPPTWDKAQALAALQVAEIPFAGMDGNTQGYAVGRSVAVSPVAQLPLKTLVHELAHVVLGHTTAAEEAKTARSLKEVEAEGVALLVLGALNQPGLEYCRGYMQHWLAGAEIPERNAQRIFKAADQILRAGRLETPVDRAEAA